MNLNDKSVKIAGKTNNMLKFVSLDTNFKRYWLHLIWTLLQYGYTHFKWVHDLDS